MSKTQQNRYKLSLADSMSIYMVYTVIFFNVSLLFITSGDYYRRIFDIYSLFMQVFPCIFVAFFAFISKSRIAYIRGFMGFLAFSVFYLIIFHTYQFYAPSLYKYMIRPTGYLFIVAILCAIGTSIDISLSFRIIVQGKRLDS